MRSRFASVLAGNHDIGTFGRLRCRMRWAGIVCTVLVCGLLVALGATASSANQGHKQSLAGAWNVTINFDDPALVDCTAPSLITADRGVVAQGCDLSLSPGYGQWRRTGNREFAVTFIGVNYGPQGTGITGSYKVRATLLVDGESFSGPFLTEVFALDGTLLFSASGTVTGEPIEIEPL
jgi:hypothetical protein